MPADLPPDTVVKKLTSAGVFYLDKVQYLAGAQYSFQHVLVITNGDNIAVTNLEGEIVIEHTRPAPGITYVGNGRPPDHTPTSPERHRSPETSQAPAGSDCAVPHRL